MSMIAIPTIDIRDGVCAPFSANGDTGPVGGDPVGVARGWASTGFRRIQVTDLDAASGNGSNASIVEDIIRDSTLEIQASGGIASYDEIERLLDAGAARVIIGGRGIEEPEWLAGAAESYPGLIVLKTDVRERRLVTRGWVRTLPLDILDVVEDLNSLPLGGLLISAAHGDGNWSNADLTLLEDIADACAFPVIAAGGVTSVSDLRALEHRGISAVLLGAELYSGLLDPRSIAQEFGG